MIVGNGDLAQALKQVDRDNILFFASGVSNSKCTDPNEFLRERELLLSQFSNRHLVYFSSLSIYYSDTHYAWHKRTMEKLIKDTWFNYTIVRLGNLDFGVNPNTLINYLTNKIRSGASFEVQNVYRHIVSLDEFHYWMRLIKCGVSNEMNITGKWTFVPDLVNEIIERSASR